MCGLIAPGGADYCTKGFLFYGAAVTFMGIWSYIKLLWNAKVLGHLAIDLAQDEIVL